MQQANHINPARRVEFEHMMPAENFGRQFSYVRTKRAGRAKGANAVKK
jgi:hypothetical protein